MLFFTKRNALPDNPFMASDVGRAVYPTFVPGTLVLVTLNIPREKFWGAILDITPAGISMRGIELDSFDDFAGQVRAGEAVSASAVFFPMHRVERVELDARNGEFPSLAERFQEKTGQSVASLFGIQQPPEARRYGSR